MKAETCRGGRHFLVKGGRHFLVKLEGRLRRSNAANASRLLSSTRLMPTAEAATPRSFVQSRRTGFFEFTISAICNATVRARSYHIQAAALGGLDKETLRVIRQPKGQTLGSSCDRPFAARIPATCEGTQLRAGALLTREWNGKLERVMGLGQGVRLERRDLWQPLADRQGDDGHELERPSVLRVANGEVRPLLKGRSQRMGFRSA